MYDVYLRLIGKCVVDFLLVLIELFSLGVTAEALRVSIGSESAISLQRWLVDPKFQVERVAPTNHSSSQKTRLNCLSHSIKAGQIFLLFCHNACICQTDRQTPFLSLIRAGIPCMAEVTSRLFTSRQFELMSIFSARVMLAEFLREKQWVSVCVCGPHALSRCAGRAVVALHCQLIDMF